MARYRDAVVFLDTHVVLWLYDARLEYVSDRAKAAIEGNNLCISWMTALELQYLYEIGRIRATSDSIIKELARSIALQVSDLSIERIVKAAWHIHWTRDVFDRMIAAEAIVTKCGLITKDTTIRKYLSLAIW